MSISSCKTKGQMAVNNDLNDYYNFRRRPSVKIISVWGEIKRVLYFILYYLHHRSFHQIPWQEIRNDKIRIRVFASLVFKWQKKFAAHSPVSSFDENLFVLDQISLLIAFCYRNAIICKVFQNILMFIVFVLRFYP